MQDTDFSFASEAASGGGGAWERLRVARFSAHEEISGLYSYDVTLVARDAAAEVDPTALIGKRASFRIGTASATNGSASGPSNPAFRIVHGIVVEASDLATSATKDEVYRVVLAPPLARAAHRRRYRIFLDKTVREIVTAVLEGDPLMHHAAGASVDPDAGLPDYQPAREGFVFRVRDAGRIDDVRARPYVVQYGESDLDFVQRLLEAEGISYHFENGEDLVLLVITDHDGGRPRIEPEALLAPHPLVESVGLGARVRAGNVVVEDYDWKKPKLALVAKAADGLETQLTEVHYAAGFADAPSQGELLAKARAQRNEIEARYAVIEGATRLLSAGAVFKLDDGEFVATSLELRGEQAGVLHDHPSGATPPPFRVRAECARRGSGTKIEESRFRPAVRTPKPRIAGTQTAVVTDDPNARGAEVHVGGPDGLSVGCVRLRFHWDKDSHRHAGEPTSCWVRVNQPFAGVGEGGVWHPRVGVECIVDFEEGDPDRPIVVGRVFNGAHLPPRTDGAHSTMKSFSTPGGAVYNELTFEDNGGSELFHLNAGKDHDIDVGNCRLETVASNAVMVVGADNTETIGAECTVTVGANHTLSVGANQTITIGANSTTTIGGNSSHTTGANKAQTIGGSETITIGATLTETITGTVTESYGAAKSTTVSASFSETFSATQTVNVGGNCCVTSGGSHDLTVNGARLMAVGGDVTHDVAGAVSNTVNGLYLKLYGGEQNTTAPSITKNGPIHFVLTPFHFTGTPVKIDSAASSTSFTGVSISAKGGVLRAYGESLSATGVSISASGITGKTGGPQLSLAGISMKIYGVGIYGVGVTLQA